MGAYKSHHRLTAEDALSRLTSSPVQTVLTSLMIGIALALPAILFTLLSNVQLLSGAWESQSRLSVFLNPQASSAAINRLRQDIEQLPGVSAIEFISAAQALQEFEDYSGFGELLSSLDENPLPPTFLVEPVVSTPDELESLVSALSEDPIVDLVQLDMEWLKRLQGIALLAERFVVTLGCILGIGVLLVIGNIIRLAIENRKDEIIVQKLVGATDAFVRRPFLYTGTWYGLGGGVMALLLVLITQLLLSGPVDELATAYGSTYSLEGIGFDGGCNLVIASAVLGWLGAWLAVGRHLSDIEPS
nr:permease-like cell division protein FtsX [Marinibactrum halimedae]